MFRLTSIKNARCLKNIAAAASADVLNGVQNIHSLFYVFAKITSIWIMNFAVRIYQSCITTDWLHFPKMRVFWQIFLRYFYIVFPDTIVIFVYIFSEVWNVESLTSGTFIRFHYSKFKEKHNDTRVWSHEFSQNQFIYCKKFNSFVFHTICSLAISVIMHSQLCEYCSV